MLPLVLLRALIHEGASGWWEHWAPALAGGNPRLPSLPQTISKTQALHSPSYQSTARRQTLKHARHANIIKIVRNDHTGIKPKSMQCNSLWGLVPRRRPCAQITPLRPRTHSQPESAPLLLHLALLGWDWPNKHFSCMCYDRCCIWTNFNRQHINSDGFRSPRYVCAFASPV